MAFTAIASPSSISPFLNTRPLRKLNSSSSFKSYHSLTIKSSLDDKSPPKSTTGKQSSWLSPDWLTSLTRSLTSKQNDDSGIPIASAKLEDVGDLLGGALFLPLFKWMNEYGPIYRLAAGPRDFVVVSDPAIAKHVLRNYGTKYSKGLVAEVSEFLFGSGFAIAEGQLWTARRRAVVPSLHKKYLSVIVDKVFCKCAQRMVDKLQADALSGNGVNMEAKFSQLTLDVIGLSVFNYNFDALNSDSPVIDAVYTALKEAEARSTDLLPYWKASFWFLYSCCFAFSGFWWVMIKPLCKIIPRQIKAENAVTVIRQTVEELIAKCKEMVESEGERIEGEEYVNDADPSILRFLLASREEVSSVQLRDDLLSMLVAGHETTGSVLTWTLYLLSKDSSALMKAQQEVDRVLQGRPPTYEDVKNLKFLNLCIIESLRLYPHPPVLLRRAQVPDVLPGDYKVNPGQDIMISVYNIHHSSKVWERAEEFIPERFGTEGPVPNESNTDFRFIPFSGGPRKCVGDQFALLEAIVALTIFLQNMNFELVPDQKINMTTGATIHTTNGLYMKLSQRQPTQAVASLASSR
ncbi:Carotene epsilon-monooxygenase, chloroplastic [Linum grandiflorum]